MSGKVTGMSKIKQLLQLYKAGASIRSISRDLKIHRKTVTDYIEKLQVHKFDINELLLQDDPVLESRFISGAAAYCDSRFEQLKEQLPDYEKSLSDKHVTRRLLWEEYIAGYPSGYQYSRFCYHLNRLSVARHPSAVPEHQAGEKLYIDFAGDTLHYVDRETGEIIEVQVFVSTLPFSDYAFCMAVPSQRSEDFLHALSCALDHYGGSPKIVVTDNLKSSAVKTDKYEPTLNRLMEDCANHYGFVVIPARPYKAKDKSLVENQVKLIYQRVYARLRNRTFFSIEYLNRALAEMTQKHNRTRMQQKPYSRQERFPAEEKQLLGELPRKAFEVKFHASLRAAKNNCIYLSRDRHYYSVPFTLTGRQADIVYTRTPVKIYCGKEPVATHRQTVGFGYTVEKEHLCSAHNHYNDRSPDYYILLLQAEYDQRLQNRYRRLLKSAAFRYQASIREITVNPGRGIDETKPTLPAMGDYIRNGECILISGTSGSGKSFLASAFGSHACKQGYTVSYDRNRWYTINGISTQTIPAGELGRCILKKASIKEEIEALEKEKQEIIGKKSQNRKKNNIWQSI
jgi:transposase/DNA replication protein DnaC